MPWYVASIIVGVRVKNPEERETDAISVDESVYLLFSKNPDEARSKAEGIGRFLASPDDSLRVNGKKGEIIYGGIRKIIEIEILNDAMNATGVPADGAGFLYALYEVDNENHLYGLGCGDPVSVKYIK